MKKETKRVDISTTFTDREAGVLIEELRSQFRIFGEKLKSLDDKIDSTMGMVAKNTEDITHLKLTVYSTKDELTKMNGKLAKIEEDIRLIKTDFSKRLTVLETSFE